MKNNKEEEYRTVEIPGKYGRIILNVPNRKPSKEEIDEYHRDIAQILLDDYKIKQREKKE